MFMTPPTKKAGEAEMDKAGKTNTGALVATTATSSPPLSSASSVGLKTKFVLKLPSVKASVDGWESVQQQSEAPQTRQSVAQSINPLTKDATGVIAQTKHTVESRTVMTAQTNASTSTSTPEHNATLKSPANKTTTKAYLNRVAEARSKMVSAKTRLKASKNTSNVIKEDVIASLDRLYELVKESEAELAKRKKNSEMEKVEKMGVTTREIEGRPSCNKTVAGEGKDVAASDKESLLLEITAVIQTRIEEGIGKMDNIQRSIEDLKRDTRPKELDIRRGRTKEGNESVRQENEAELINKLVEHSKRLEDNSQKMEKLNKQMENHKEILQEKHLEVTGRATYASVAAGCMNSDVPVRAALHSVMVTSTDETETGEEVINKIRKAVNARESGIQVERIKKVKNQKVIVGCRTEEEKAKIKEKLTQAKGLLSVEDVENKDPLLMLRDVLAYNTDDEIIQSLRNQNGRIFDSLDKQETRMEIKYRKKTRNPHTNHVVLKVSPHLWTRMLRVEAVHIDLQRVRVFDQSPLVQCSLCLGYGHSRRFCKEPQEKCSHCGGPHIKAKCDTLLAGVAPECCNCKSAKLENIQHNAFSQECPVRRKWDALARASVAYC